METAHCFIPPIELVLSSPVGEFRPHVIGCGRTSGECKPEWFRNWFKTLVRRWE